jgi:photosystem II stability/assembly factor-like uncharacterized protein
VPSSTLYVAVLETRNYIVGTANAPSGLYARSEVGEWVHKGWRNVRCFGLAIDEDDPNTVYLAGGNGVLRSRDRGATWRVTTGWRVAEVLDVALDPFVSEGVYAATAYGPWRSDDAGETWRPLPPPGDRPNTTFMPVFVPDAEQPGRLIAGTEEGLFESTDGGSGWRAVGPRVPVRALVRSATRPEVWLAGTDGQGVLRSADDGVTWSSSAEGTTAYAVAIDPGESERMVAAGYGTGLLISEDGGSTWTPRPLDDLPTPDGIPIRALHALAFDPDEAGRLWLGTVGAGAFITDDLGMTCEDAGLPDTTIYDFTFVSA